MRAISLLTLAAWVALATPADGRCGSGGSKPDKRLGALEEQLVLPSKISARLAWARRSLEPSGLQRLEKMGRTLAPAIAAGNDFDSLRGQAEREVTRSYPRLAPIAVSEAAFIVMSMATQGMDEDIRLIMAEIKEMTAAKQKMREMIKKLDDWLAREMSEHPDSEDIDTEEVASPGTAARTAQPATKTSAPLFGGMTLETKTSPVIQLEYVEAPVVPKLPPWDTGVTVSGLKSMLDEAKGKLDGMNEMSEMTYLRLQITMDRRSKFISTLSQMMKRLSAIHDLLVQNIK